MDIGTVAMFDPFVDEDTSLTRENRLFDGCRHRSEYETL